MSGESRELEVGPRVRSLNWRTIDFRAIAEPVAIASPLALIVNAQEPVMSIVALLFLAHAWRDRDWAWARRSWFLAALALWVYALARTLALNPTATGALTALHSIHYAIYGAALAEWILPRPEARARLLYATIATVVFYAADCLLQFAIGRDIIGRALYEGSRLTSVFRKPGVGAELGWLYLPAVIGLWRKGFPWLAAALGFASVAAIALSGDRMGLLTALAAIVLFAVLARRVRKTLLMALPAFAALLAALLYFNPAIYQRQVEQTAETIDRMDQSAYGLVFSTALRVARDHPLFGVGVRDYQAFCVDEKYGPLRVGPQQHQRCQGHPHNVYLQWLVETGIIGLALYVAFVGLTLKTVIQAAPAHRDDLMFIALAVCLALRFWPIQSATSFYSSWATAPLFLILGWTLSYCRPEADAA